MGPLSSLTVRQRMVVAPLLALLPLIVYAYISLQDNLSSARAQHLQASAATAKIVAVAVDQMLEGAAQILTTLAAQPEFKNGNREQIDSLLAKVLPFNPAFTTIIALSNDGVVLGEAQVSWAEPVDITDHWYSRDVMAAREVAVSGRLIGYMTDEPSVAIAVPLKNESGQRTGILVVGVSLRQLEQSLAEVAQQGETGIIVVDSDGAAIAYPEWSYVQGRTSLMSLLPVQHVLLGETGTLEYHDPDNQELLLASYEPVKKADWGVVVTYPVSAIYASFEESTVTRLFWLAVAIMLGTGLAGFYTDRIANPIRSLAAHAMVLANSRGLIVERLGRDEVGQLGSALSCLSDNLSENMQELTRLRNKVQDQAIKLQGALMVAAQVQSQERKMLALDVHDGLAQLVAGALFEAQASEKTFRSNPQRSMMKLQSAEKLLAHAISGIDGVIYNLRSSDLEQGELLEGIRRSLSITEDLFGISGRLELTGVPIKLSTDVERNVYYIVQEAIHNSRKHSGANKISVIMEFGGETLRVSISDNGRGFVQNKVEKETGRHLGLIGMQERAQSVGGELTIASAPNSGTVVTFGLHLVDSNQRSIQKEPWRVGAT